MSLPLHEKKVLITRELTQAKSFSEKVKKKGGIPIEVPLLTISCNTDEKNRPYMQNLKKYEWIFFTSTNGVHCFFQVLRQYGIKKTDLESIHIAAVGSKTAQELESYGLQVHFIPSSYTAETMADEFLAEINNPKQILLVRGNRSRDVLPNCFSEIGILYDSVVVYDTIENREVEEQLNDVLNNEKLDFITFTSPSTVEAFMRMKKSSISISTDTTVICIGSTTETTAKQYQLKNIEVANTYTIDGMVELMSQLQGKGV